MIQIGDFVYPEHTTARVREIEAKSKTRKRIDIDTVLEAPAPTELQNRLNVLRRAIERFDIGEAHLVFNPGRFYLGRRRYWIAVPDPSGRVAWARLAVLSRDRFERGLELRQQILQMDGALVQFTLENAGNWASPPFFEIAPAQSIEGVSIEWDGGVFELTGPVQPGQTVAIDSENRLVQIDGDHRLAQSNETFPMIEPGSHAFAISADPPGAEAQVTVNHRDVWV